VTVLADTAIRAKDLTRFRGERTQVALETMQNKTSKEEIATAEAELAAAMAQLQAIRKLRHRA
jgi:F-type H+-transporting ATPase subunit epsilon